MCELIRSVFFVNGLTIIASVVIAALYIAASVVIAALYIKPTKSVIKTATTDNTNCPILMFYVMKNS